MTGEQILIVEDDIIIVMELEARLQDLGYSVCGSTASGEEALLKVDELRPALVLMDIRLKGAMDGIEAAAEIRTRFDIPVVYLTAHADSDTLWRAKLTEPYGYVIKPFEGRELHTAIEMAMYKHKMETRLRESEQWLSTALRSIGDAVVATDEWGRISIMNPVAEALTGCGQGDALGRWIAQVVQLARQEPSWADEEPLRQTLREATPLDLNSHVLYSLGGKTVPIDGNTAPIIDDKGRTKGIVVVFRDVSGQIREEEERSRLQAQLFHAQKMEAVGVLTGQIAHNLNNLMTTVVGYSSLLLAGLGDEGTWEKGLAYVTRAGEQAAFLTQQILSLGRRPAPESRVLDLNSLITRLEEMVKTLGGEAVEVVSSLDPQLWHCKADPAEIEQVILNLVLNATQAMPEGGKLTIETKNWTVAEGHAEQSSEAYPGAFLRLSVTDTGIGMAPETLERIFEPFFSTKERGTGLGLSITQGLARQYEGWVEVDTEPGQGATFRVYLPACFEDLEAERPQLVELPDIRGRGERILLIEDDEGVCTAVSEMLRAGGYVVLAAQGMAEALGRFHEEDKALDLVLSDLVLPDGDGLALADHLVSLEPDLAVLLMSGYTDERVQWSLVAEKGIGLLKKPFGIAELLPAVREALEAVRRPTP